MKTTTPNLLRSRTMRAVRSQHTKPELIVRKLLHRLGYRFRLHRKHLPGSPDIVLPSRRTAIFVNGCFWHGHDCKRGARVPKENADYWRSKIARNKERDEMALSVLQDAGWQVLTLWECELKDLSVLEEQLTSRLAKPIATDSPSLLR